MKVLLVSPGFHGYWRSVRDALASRGHDVAVHVYDDFTGLPAKVRNKLRYELPDRLGTSRGRARMTRDLTALAVEAVRASSPEAVVVIKGDLLGSDLWDELDDRRLPRAVWLYDELRRMTFADGLLDRIGPIATYSLNDRDSLLARGLDVRHLPLAYDPALTPRSGTRDSEVVFVGARYPKREEALTALVRQGIAVRAFGRDWSTHPIDRLRTWDLRRPSIPAARDLDRAQAYAVMAGAAATINIHGDQDGFTMRTFEACGVGAVQLVDRPDITHLYEPDVEVATYESDEELVDLCRRATADPAWATRLRERGRARTLAEHTFDDRAAVLEQMW